MNIILSTLPREGAYKSWLTPASLQPAEVKYMPLGLLSLATNVKDYGKHVEIIDPSSDQLSIEKTAEIINSMRPDVVGFSATTQRCYALYRLLKLVRAPWKVVGGPHCTYHAEEVMQWGADAVFVGPLADEEFKIWLKAPHKGIIRCNTDINKIKYPDRRLIDFENYFYNGKVIFSAKRRMSLFSSVGCPNACKFCSVQTKKVQYKMPSAVVAEMQYLVNNCDAESVHIFDDNFNINKNHLIGVLDCMEKVGWSTEWSMRGQVMFDLSLVPRLKAMGLKRIHVGIESFDDNVLRWMRKNHRYKHIVDFCKAMNDNEIEILGYFIVETPVLPDAECAPLDVVDTAKKLNIKPYINILFPEPDTDYYKEYLEAGYFDFWSKYFKNPVPDFEIPHPMGETYKATMISNVEAMMRRAI